MARKKRSKESYYGNTPEARKMQRSNLIPGGEFMKIFNSWYTSLKATLEEFRGTLIKWYSLNIKGIEIYEDLTRRDR